MENRSVTVKFHIMPASKLNQIVGYMDDGSIKIKIKAKPIEGRANLELISFLADILEKRKSEIEIISGLSSRNKIVRIWGIDNNNLQKIIFGKKH
jgi:uncharacterized protein (TIGR00251 family)